MAKSVLLSVLICRQSLCCFPRIQQVLLGVANSRVMREVCPVYARTCALCRLKILETKSFRMLAADTDVNYLFHLTAFFQVNPGQLVLLRPPPSCSSRKPREDQWNGFLTGRMYFVPPSNYCRSTFSNGLALSFLHS